MILIIKDEEGDVLFSGENTSNPNINERVSLKEVPDLMDWVKEYDWQVKSRTHILPNTLEIICRQVNWP